MEPVRVRIGRARYAIPLLVATVIFATSVVTPPSGALSPLGPFGLVGQDKWLHCLAYAGQAGVLAAVLDRHRHGRLAAFVLTVGYGIFIELVQYPLPARAFDLSDIAANSLGAALGVLAWVLVGRRLLRLK
ncbi:MULTISPECIES: VanZ family protein [unclassified Haladaptatus]|uniref:VanZ family protein n=1 Tax=unclassified Haladaptatus TaxID=2622732 RepID=UPI0023E89320|nr:MULTISPECIES: VanZ family protein [unclassified Haladaptatus]